MWSKFGRSFGSGRSSWGLGWWIRLKSSRPPVNWARNTVTYGGGGSVKLDVLEQNSRQGLRLTFVDHGPGIADVELALKDGYTTGGGLGMGLGGSKRLMNEFHLVSQVGQGTFVRVTKWR